MTTGETTPRPGRLFVISAPSGAGKTSLVRQLLERNPQLRLSVSHTTRPPRPQESPGREYHFVSPEQFEQLRTRSEFLESADVFDHHYGTACQPVVDHLQQGHNVLLEIDWQGAQQVRAAMPDAVTVFILPPTLAALRERLQNRRTDSQAVIDRRLRDAVSDMGHWSEFDYVIVNDSFARALSDLESVLAEKGEHLRRDRPELRPLTGSLLDAKNTP